ncbi:actin-like protein ALP7 [Besnoitia besnoiti]|uniref:Actin-like protein ALP7 n=1 Tax=Besnoitia besnoiti TaxID=94643 RepID=A0A2A9M6Y2_BESBE|nr:actin-like protein ALP7 [Besnoitia besnoiti]PFH31646.1 actin-like protein ALP7 [Besnoitia besnoiti]
MIADKDATEDLWEAALKKFVAPETGDMVYLLTCPPLTSNASKEWIFEIFFEKFKCKRMALLQPGPLSLFSSGRSRGLVVEIGHSLTSAVPVFEGFPLAYATQRMFRAGGAITAALSQALAECSWFDRHLHLCTIPVMEDMKCRLCRVAVPNLHSRVLKAETPDFEERGFQLPDGSVIDVIRGPIREINYSFLPMHCVLCPLQLDQQVRFGPAELLFDDSIEVRDTPNLDEVPPSLQSELHTCETLQSLVHSAIATTDPEFQEEMRKNIVLAGGSSLLKNFANRLHGELLCIQPEEKDPFFIAADSHRRFSAWVGGSMLASLGTFEKFCISRHEYEDGGRPMADVIHERNVGR